MVGAVIGSAIAYDLFAQAKNLIKNPGLHTHKSINFHLASLFSIHECIVTIYMIYLC